VEIDVDYRLLIETRHPAVRHTEERVMEKQITELKLDEIETVVGGVVYASTVVVQSSASMYKAPSATTWSSPSVPANALSARLL
jgi:hypothetical protein